MPNPVVSVIMGVYNAKSKYNLVMAINSVLNQSYTNFEFIICDDGSDDNTFKWLTEIKTKSSKIVLIRNEKNMGLAFSLNRCLKIAKGKFIARQDADDYSEAGRLKKQVDFLESNEHIDLIGSNINYFDNNGIYQSFYYPEQPQKKDFLFVSPFNHGSIMVRKSSIDKVGGYLDLKETKRCEDYDLFLRMFLQDMKFYNIQECLYNFREDEYSIKRRDFSDRLGQVITRKKYLPKIINGAKLAFYVYKPLMVMMLPANFLQKIKKCFYKDRMIQL